MHRTSIEQYPVSRACLSLMRYSVPPPSDHSQSMVVWQCLFITGS